MKIINKNSNPERSIYYLGSKVLEVLKSTSKKRFDSFEVYIQIKQLYNISFSLYIFTLDWLFLLGLIRQNETGSLEKCF